jgi:cytochrome c biogenesis DsbD-like protein
MVAQLLGTLFLLLAVGTPHLTMATSASPTPAAPATPGSTIKLFVDVIPDPKVHVYAPGAKDYLPIALEVMPAAGITVGKLTYPKAQDLYFEPLKEHVPVFSAPFRLVQDVAIGRAVKRGQSLIVAGVLKYQACDDTICFNPVTAPVSWTVAIK